MLGDGSSDQLRGEIVAADAERVGEEEDCEQQHAVGRGKCNYAACYPDDASTCS